MTNCCLPFAVNVEPLKNQLVCYKNQVTLYELGRLNVETIQSLYSSCNDQHVYEIREA